MTPTVLALVPYYVPGHRGGGPIRSIENLSKSLGHEFTFKIVCLDRDLGDSEPFPDVPHERWVPIGNALVRYVRPGLSGLRIIRTILRSEGYEVLYLNSFFSWQFSIWPIVLASVDRRVKLPMVLAPRGEFAKGALRFKWLKKFVFLTLIKTLGIYDRQDLIFQASTEFEAVDIGRELGIDRRATIARPVPDIVTARDLSAPISIEKLDGRSKRPGALNVVFLSRIVRLKNLLGAIEALAQVRGEISFTIFGPIEDRNYWAECQSLIQTLPPHISVRYGGEVPHADVASTLQKHHVFLLPTFGENYGHVIAEALAAGCICVISNQTPWRHLDRRQVGWDIALDDAQAFTRALQEAADMDHSAFRERSLRARQVAEEITRNDEPIDQHRQLFRLALSSRQQRAAVALTEEQLKSGGQSS